MSRSEIVIERTGRAGPYPYLPEVGRPRKYPFDRMRPGDSFAIANKAMRQRVAVCMLKYCRRHGGQYAIRRERRNGNGAEVPGKWRCWRLQ